MKPATRVRTAIAAFALLLLIPVVGMLWQDAASLEKFHKRRLKAWPDRSVLTVAPTDYFGAAKAWLADRVFPIVEASHLMYRIRFYVLLSAPRRNLSLADDGYIFLNGTDEKDVNGLIESVCIGTHQDNAARAVSLGLAKLARYSRNHGIPIDVVMMPNSTEIYGDRLPPSTPRKYRDACSVVAHGVSPLLQVASLPEVHFVYPLRELLAARDDPAMYSKANWHPRGLSVRIARDAYLAAIGHARPTTETMTPVEVTAELTTDYGIGYRTPAYRVDNVQVHPDTVHGTAMAQAIADLFVDGAVVESHLYVNAQAPSKEKVLMLSDSFGIAAGEMYAGAFAEVFQVMTNDAAEDRLPELVQRLEPWKPDRLVFLANDANVQRVLIWSRIFGLAAPPVMPGSDPRSSTSH